MLMSLYIHSLPYALPSRGLSPPTFISTGVQAPLTPLVPTDYTFHATGHFVCTLSCSSLYMYSVCICAGMLQHDSQQELGSKLASQWL